MASSAILSKKEIAIIREIAFQVKKSVMTLASNHTIKKPMFN